METKSVNKLEALALIVGPALALLFFMLEPGRLLIDTAEPGDAAATITALATNKAMANTSGLVVPLSLVLMIYGLAGINRVIQEESMAAALSRLGVLFMIVGAIGWILTSGLNHILADTRLGVEEAFQQAIAIYRVDSGLTLISSATVSVGFLTFSLGYSAMHPPGFSKIAALVITAISILALVAIIMGYIGSNQAMITVAQACYLPWVIWLVILGVRFLKNPGQTKP